VELLIKRWSCFSIIEAASDLGFVELESDVPAGRAEAFLVVDVDFDCEGG
jgi:hypothetical protein